MKKKILLSLAALIVVSLLFTGCGALFGGKYGIDGVWVYKATIGNYTLTMEKIKISDDIAKTYINAGALGDVLILTFGGEPTGEISWGDPVNGSVKVKGNTITFNYNGTTSTATLAKDKKSFTMEIPDSNGGGTTTGTFKKQ